MTVEQRTELQDRLREILGERPAATLWGMLPGREDLTTTADLSAMGSMLRGEIAGVREELKIEIAGVREDVADLGTEVAILRTEMEHRYATRDDVQGMADKFIDVMAGHVRTFIVVQAATVVGMSGILFTFLRFF